MELLIKKLIGKMVRLLDFITNCNNYTERYFNTQIIRFIDSTNI
jgi:hypothetical protein